MNTEADHTQQSSAGPDPLAGRTVDEFASVGILTCTPDAPLDEVAWLMANNRVHAVLVADDTGPEPPVIADTDLIAAAGSGHFDQLSAGGSPSKASRRMPVGILSNLDRARAISGRS